MHFFSGVHHGTAGRPRTPVGEAARDPSSWLLCPGVSVRTQSGPFRLALPPGVPGHGCIEGGTPLLMLRLPEKPAGCLSANTRTTRTHAVARYHRKLTAPCYSLSPRWTERGRFPCRFLHSGGQRPNLLAALFACAGMFELERHHGLGELRRLLTTHPHPAARDAARCWCYRGLPRVGLVPGRGGLPALELQAARTSQTWPPVFPGRAVCPTPRLATPHSATMAEPRFGAWSGPLSGGLFSSCGLLSVSR
jgi:hypothetical protein